MLKIQHKSFNKNRF